jgi:hypothetical protein
VGAAETCLAWAGLALAADTAARAPGWGSGVALGLVAVLAPALVPAAWIAPVAAATPPVLRVLGGLLGRAVGLLLAVCGAMGVLLVVDVNHRRWRQPQK